MTRVVYDSDVIGVESSDEMLPLGSNVLAGRLCATTSSDLETLLL